MYSHPIIDEFFVGAALYTVEQWELVARAINDALEGIPSLGPISMVSEYFLITDEGYEFAQAFLTANEERVLGAMFAHQAS